MNNEIQITAPHQINTHILYSNIKTVNFWLFLIIGTTHFLTGMFVANQIATKEMWLINRVLDVPFFLVSYLYFAALFKLHLEPKAVHFNLWDLIIIIIGISSFLFLQIYDLLFPNLLP